MVPISPFPYSDLLKIKNPLWIESAIDLVTKCCKLFISKYDIYYEIYVL